MSIYDKKPDRFLSHIHSSNASNPQLDIYCAGFEYGKWRCEQFAFHLAEWLPDYALPEKELSVNHANSLQKIHEAAVRVYTSDKYSRRGEAGEIALHAICRDFFQTIPISSRVFYKSASNEVIKAFDLVHARSTKSGIQIWLGESKLYSDPSRAIGDAIRSVREHIEEGFLTNQKIILGPQIPHNTPHYDEIKEIFKKQTSLDVLINKAVFVIGILCNSGAAKSAVSPTQTYISGITSELGLLAQKLSDSGLAAKLSLALVYVPLADKKAFVSAFDKRLKGLQ